MMAMGVSVFAVGKTAVQESLFKNPRFSLRQIHVITSGMLTPAQITRATGLVEGVNLLTINLRDVRERVMQLPAVESASVTRDFNGKLTLAVTQREPVAWVKCAHLNWLPKQPGRSLLVDASGVAIPAETVLPDMADLPVVEDDTIDQITPGAPIESARFASAASLAKRLAARNEEDKVKLRSVHAPNRYALIASFSDGADVTFSVDNVDAQLGRYEQLRANAIGRGWKLASVNLVAERNTPVTMQAEVPVAPRVVDPAPETRPPAKAKSKSSSAQSSRKADAAASRTKSSSKSRGTRQG